MSSQLNDILGTADRTFCTPEEFLLASRAHQTSYTMDLLGNKLCIDPEVFSPRYSESCRFIVANWDLMAGQLVLDMGTGTGILSICAMLLAKVSKVISIDINPAACECAKKNVRAFGLQGCIDVRQGNLFEPLLPEEKFDRIMFNPPYHNGVPKSLLEYAVYDPGYTSLRSFLQNARFHLRENGRIILNYSELGNILHLESQLSEFGYASQIVAKTTVTPKRLLYSLE